MVRNIVLAISSLALLLVLYLAYGALVQRPVTGPGDTTSDLPAHADPNSPAMELGQDLSVPGGKRIVFKIYDERTGRPTDLISCDEWQPVPGSKNDFRVTRPELTMLLPSGMVAVISADDGALTMDRVERTQSKPKKGRLSGNVKIVIDRDTSIERTPRSERPQDLITIDMEDLDFDVERGELRTAGRVWVQNTEFEIAGVGLDLIWNQADNRVETLTIAEGDECVFYTRAGLFGEMSGGAAPAAETPVVVQSPASQPGTTTPQATSRAARPRRSRHATAYRCTLAGDVTAEQRAVTPTGDEAVIGSLQADEVELLFDLGDRTTQMFKAGPTSRPASQPTSAPTSAPATQPASGPRDRLVLRWSGPLHLGPASKPADPDQPRMHFIARGAPVVLARGARSLHCGHVEYHDETKRIWLKPVGDETVNLAISENVTASAQNVYVDRGAGVVKLIGDVALCSRRGSDPNAPVSAIRSSQWAELFLAERPAGAPTQTSEDTLLEVGGLKSASFVGDVEVDLGGQQLAAHRLAVTFRPGADAGERIEDLLDTATATGVVHLTSGAGVLDCAQLALTFARPAQGDVYPQRLHAVGSVVLQRGTGDKTWVQAVQALIRGPELGGAARRAQVRGDELLAILAPPGPQRAADAPDLIMEHVEIIGRAHLVSPENRVAARGQRITARFAQANELVTATVAGTAAEPGWLYAHPYSVRGQRIDLNREALTLHVDGPSRLAFKTYRSLQGQEHGEPIDVVVTSTERLHIDGRENTIVFTGDVRAASAAERLEGRTLKLTLEDVPEPFRMEKLRVATSPWHLLRALYAAATQRSQRNDPLSLRVAAGGQRFQKEPGRLIAEDAQVTSETYIETDPEPILHASISAPTLEADIAHRQIFTQGLTRLLMIDRRAGGASDEATQMALGFPSALLSDGASQTAMECVGRMTYTLGPDGPDRRDTIVFEDGVYFRHRAGAAVPDEQLIRSPGVGVVATSQPTEGRDTSLECDRLECWFAARSSGAAGTHGGALTRMPLQLASLLASGSVYLRDLEGSRVRGVNADRIEFNRAARRVHVWGSPLAKAWVSIEDTASGQSDVHFADELSIDLLEGTIQAEELQGEIQRP